MVDRSKAIRKARDFALEKSLCKSDAHYFIFDAGYLLTKDEHEPEHPIKPFPKFDHLRILLDYYLVSGRLLKPQEAKFAKDLDFLKHIYNAGVVCTEKSRHMQVTWLTCAYLLWRARSYSHQLIMVQSKKEEDAAELVFKKEPVHARVTFMEWNLPKPLQVLDFNGGASYNNLFFPNGSHIWGIPEGGDIIRAHNPSVLFGDECAYQPEFGHAFTAALPAVKGGGQFIGVSSANPGEFAALVEAE